MSKMKELDTEIQTGTILTGQQIPMARLLVLRSGLKVELLGMKVSRGVSVFSIVKKEFNLKGNKKSVYDQFNKIVTEKTGVEKK